jgi:hypothetical protein
MEGVASGRRTTDAALAEPPPLSSNPAHGSLLLLLVGQELPLKGAKHWAASAALAKQPVLDDVARP